MSGRERPVRGERHQALQTGDLRVGTGPGNQVFEQTVAEDQGQNQ